MGARLNQSWELETQPCRTTTESRAQPGDSDERQKTEKQVRGTFVISRISSNGICEAYSYSFVEKLIYNLKWGKITMVQVKE